LLHQCAPPGVFASGRALIEIQPPRLFAAAQARVCELAQLDVRQGEELVERNSVAAP